VLAIFLILGGLSLAILAGASPPYEANALVRSGSFFALASSGDTLYAASDNGGSILLEESSDRGVHWTPNAVPYSAVAGGSPWNHAAVAVDGNDMPAVGKAARTGVEGAREGAGPSLIECKTYRIRGHSKSDRNLYRTKEEIEAWRQADPIARLENEVRQCERFAADELLDIEKAAQRQIDDALEFAKASPDPDPAQLTRDVYAE
jgi:hypothetical protein